MSPVALSIAVARLNARLKNRGLSAKEMWTQRDQCSHKQISLNDDQIILRQYELKHTNHPMSAKSKVPCGRFPPMEHVGIGDLV